ncbi:hypothetical protein PFLA_a0154 [Pseudoalteromonas flavipulchra NCIMB 2033 = ATCC BAA-314]|nr:hypothetical protein [Pseudoalteromonas flavipulchra NCIMB 2033 = ATCC BAA-314]
MSFSQLRHMSHINKQKSATQVAHYAFLIFTTKNGDIINSTYTSS